MCYAFEGRHCHMYDVVGILAIHRHPLPANTSNFNRTFSAASFSAFHFMVFIGYLTGIVLNFYSNEMVIMMAL